MNFRIVGLPADEFTHLFGLSDADLAAAGCVRRTAIGNHPCRVSLSDSRPGEQLLPGLVGVSKLLGGHPNLLRCTG